MNDEPRDDSPAAAEAWSSSEESRHAPVLASLGDGLESSDVDREDEDLTGTGEWSLEQERSPGEETVDWKPVAEDVGSASLEPGKLEPLAASAEVADSEHVTDEGESTSAAAEAPEDEVVEEEEAPEEEATDVAQPTNIDWYILKVASNREESIKDGLLRRARIAGLDRFIKEIIVPTETISEYKNGKRRTRKQKVWPGYLVVNMEINEETWFLVRETPGIGDFTGAAGKPSPMLKEEVEKILRLVRPADDRKKEKEAEKHVIPFKTGDKVKIKEGTFMDFEGEVESVDQAKSSVTVMINIFGRPTPAEVSSWQLEAL